MGISQSHLCATRVQKIKEKKWRITELLVRSFRRKRKSRKIRTECNQC